MSESFSASFGVQPSGDPGGIKPELQTAAVGGRPRFTLDGGVELENHLACICELVLAGVRSLVPGDRLEALVLGGGYGRGQGGVEKSQSADRPYNDLEFYAFLRGNRLWNQRKYHAALQRLGEELSPEADLHVEFKVDSLERLRRSPMTMFSYDLVAGHRVIWDGARIGEHRTPNTEHRTSNTPTHDPDIGRSIEVGPPSLAGTVFAGCEHHLDRERIPLHEATRLLFNRCTGLLLAKELLRNDGLTPGQSDFIGRNLAKAQLAFGDAVLTAFGKYHWSCMERREQLSQLADALFGVPALAGSDRLKAELQTLRAHHSAGVEFKLHPHRIVKSRAEFKLEHRKISMFARQIWLWLESRRLGRPFSSVRDYVASTRDKCPDTSRIRNLLLNVKTFGPASAFDRRRARYPRERLFNSLPMLLWEVPLNDLKVKRALQKQLRTTASDWQSLVAAYKTVWPAFS